MRKTSKIQNFEPLVSSMSIYFQDESTIEMSQKVWRVLCMPWEKPVRTNGKEKRHDWLSVSWVRRIDGKFYYKTSKSKKWEDFLSFVYQLRVREQKEWMILIVDNARIHRTKKIESYCEKNKIVIVYLPPYSPDLNPIEILRKMLKKEYRKIQRKYDDIREWIKEATKLMKQRISTIKIENLVTLY